MSDKTVAELMALADAYAVSSGVDGQHDAPCDSKYTAARRAALEQAIRRAVDWGEPKCWMAEIGSVSLPVGNPSRITIKAFYETQAEADVAADESDFDNIVTPLYARRTA